MKDLCGGGSGSDAVGRDGIHSPGEGHNLSCGCGGDDLYAEVVEVMVMAGV